MNDNQEPMPEAEAHAEPTPVSERFVDVFTAPGKAMAAVAERPMWFLPLLVVFAIMSLYVAANINIIIPEVMERSIDNARGDQVEAMEKILDMFVDPPAWLRVVAGIAAGIFAVIFSITLPTLVVHMFLKLSGGVAVIGQTLGVTAWASLIVHGFRTLLSWIVIVVTGSAQNANLTAASLLPEYNPEAPLSVIANLYGDPFMYWALAVTILGLAKVHRLGLIPAATVVVATYVLLSIFPIGKALLDQKLAGN